MANHRIYNTGGDSDSLTTGDIAKMAAVSNRTAARWIDDGLIKGYRIPGSRHRRVRRADAVEFFKAHEIPYQALCK